MPDTKKASKSPATPEKTSVDWSDAEVGAMKNRARELKAEARANKDKADGERDLLAAIAGMPEPDRSMATRLHAIIEANAPALWAKTYYGMPAYARDGKVVCFFKPASKFKDRYATFGFEQAAALDDGTMWPTGFALMELTAADEARIAALVKKAMG